MIETVLKIDGMQCPMCEAHINDVVRKNCRIRKVASSYRKQECRILSDNPLEYGTLKKSIQNTGYSVLSLDSREFEEQQQKKGFFARLFN